MRDESRGSHYKAEFPDRNDEKFMKTTMAKYDAGANHGPKITYEDIDVSLVKPVRRDYGATQHKAAS
jgi:succinate dehydrogenase / fumarate reductase flavoprotein subunit